MEDESDVKTKIVGVISTRMGADGLEYLLRNEEQTGEGIQILIPLRLWNLELIYFDN